MAQPQLVFKSPANLNTVGIDIYVAVRAISAVYLDRAGLELYIQGGRMDPIATFGIAEVYPTRADAAAALQTWIARIEAAG